MKKTELSIIITAYNDQDYILQCLDSIQAQEGFKQHEVIIVDDASIDNTPQFLDEFADAYQNVRVIHLTKNSGVSVARNVGIDEANGKYLIFIDADDKIGADVNAFDNYFEIPTYCETIANLDYKESDIPHRLRNKPFTSQHFTNKFFTNLLHAAYETKADVVLGGKITLNNGTGCITRQVYENAATYGQSPKDKSIVLAQAETRESANYALYSRKMLDKNNLRFLANMKLDEDILFCMLAVLYADRVATTPNVTYLYNRHSNSLSNISDAKEFTQKYAIAHIQRYSVLLNKLYDRPHYAKTFNTYMAKFAKHGQKHQYKLKNFPPKKCAFCCNLTCTACPIAEQMPTLFQKNIEQYLGR